jgi:hypothetical protein
MGLLLQADAVTVGWVSACALAGCAALAAGFGGWAWRPLPLAGRIAFVTVGALLFLAPAIVGG